MRVPSSGNCRARCVTMSAVVPSNQRGKAYALVRHCARVTLSPYASAGRQPPTTEATPRMRRPAAAISSGRVHVHPLLNQ